MSKVYGRCTKCGGAFTMSHKCGSDIKVEVKTQETVMKNQWTDQDDERMHELLGVCRHEEDATKNFYPLPGGEGIGFHCKYCTRGFTEKDVLNFHNPGEREFLLMVNWCLKRDFYFTISPHNTKGVYCRVEICIFCRAETCIFGPIEVTAPTAPLALRDALRAYGGKG